MSGLAKLLQNIEEYLALQQDENFDSIQVNPDTLKELLSYFESPEPAHKSENRVVLEQTRATQAPKPKPIKKTAPQIVLPDFKSMDEIAKHIHQCKRCPLSKTRTCTVPGEGKIDHPDIMFIGEGPRAEEDKQGLPLIGPAGQLFEKMIAAMGYSKDQIFLSSIVKCRAFYPETNKDRRPTPAEISQCIPYLKAQIKLIQPKVIVALGQTAAQLLLDETAAITQLHGKWAQYEGIDLMPTYQPALLLRFPEYKGDAWTDLKAVLKHLGKPIPHSKSK